MIERVAVIGSGIAGLACARTLQRKGREVTVFDKGRNVGGRAGTRLTDGHRFDHGAQFFTVADPRFYRLVDELTTQGVVAPWIAEPSHDRSPRLVGTPSMRQVPQEMAVGLNVNQSTEVTGLVREASGSWTLRTESTSHDTTRPEKGRPTQTSFGPFDAVVTTAPAPQSARLLKHVAPEVSTRLGEARYAPCWALMVGFERPVPCGFDYRECPSGPISWLARMSSKPGNPTTPDCWTAHASVDYSLSQLEAPAESVRQELLQHFLRLVQFEPSTSGAPAAPRPTPSLVRVHRWRYAKVEQSLDTNFLWDNDQRIGIAGDFCLGPRVECAFLSGLALGRHLLTTPS